MKILFLILYRIIVFFGYIFGLNIKKKSKKKVVFSLWNLMIISKNSSFDRLFFFVFFYVDMDVDVYVYVYIFI